VPVTATEVKSTVLLDSVVIEQLFLERLSILPCEGVGWVGMDDALHGNNPSAQHVSGR